MAILSTFEPQTVSPIHQRAEGYQTLIQTVTKVSTTQLFTVTLGSGRETNGAGPAGAEATSYVAPAPANNGISQSALGGIIGGVVGAIVLLLLAWAWCGRVRFPKSQYGSSTSGATSGSSSGSGSSSRSVSSGSEMEETGWVNGGPRPGPGPGPGPRPMPGGPPMPGEPMPLGGAWPGAPGASPMGRGGPPGMGRGMPMPMPMPMGMGGPAGRGGPPPMPMQR